MYKTETIENFDVYHQLKRSISEVILNLKHIIAARKHNEKIVFEKEKLMIYHIGVTISSKEITYLYKTQEDRDADFEELKELLL
ncbi:MAG: hypothetical protein K2Q03_06025 [Sphingobacteriaceae bacterium]|nr:hypothetical protein [Sphingobacteriaceae bacterium]